MMVEWLKEKEKEREREREKVSGLVDESNDPSQRNCAKSNSAKGNGQYTVQERIKCN